MLDGHGSLTSVLKRQRQEVAQSKLARETRQRVTLSLSGKNALGESGGRVMEDESQHQLL